MTSIVVVMAIIAIFAITGEATDIRPDFKKEFPKEVPSRIIGKCPPLGSSNVKVVGMGQPLIITGNAFFNQNISGLMHQSFSMDLVITDPRNSKKRMEYFHFSCDSKSPSASEMANKDPNYVRIYGLVNHKPGNTKFICALYDKVNDNAMMFRMAVSKDAECGGLSSVLSHPDMMTTQSSIATVLLFIKKPLTPPPANTPTTTVTIGSTADQQPEVQDSDGGRGEQRHGNEGRNLIAESPIYVAMEDEKTLINQPIIFTLEDIQRLLHQDPNLRYQI